MNQESSIKITTSAKVNLFLHVTGKKENDYHELQSLVTFANYGDIITITPADKFTFSFDSTSENLPVNENNLAICAANLLSSELGKNLNCHIHLTKNIPIGAGLGGGSSDAAATIRGLLNFWNTNISKDKLDNILLKLGADVPACYHAQSCYFENIGEVITPIQSLPTLHAVLIHPNKHSSTKDVFDNYIPEFSKNILLPKTFNTENDLILFLKKQRNDLTNAVIKTIPDISNILEILDKQEGIALSRMSGSGSACFGLFSHQDQAQKAAKVIKKEQPNWWIQAALLT